MAKKNLGVESSAVESFTWNSSAHPISDLRDWAKAKQLEIRPDFQRREVWSEAAQVSLIDTVIRNIPMPKVYLHAEIRDEKTHRTVIDGQQRITSILKFLRDELVLPYSCPEGYGGKIFTQLEATQRNAILSYKIDTNEIVQATDSQIRELYSRVNKYTRQLNKQELRRADFPGDFLNMSERLSSLTQLVSFGVFSSADYRRMNDIEFVSELLALLVDGPLNKKGNLDSYYEQLSKWPVKAQKATELRFTTAITSIEKMFDEETPLSGTRFHQKADFYSLFAAVDGLLTSGGKFPGDLSALKEDLAMLDSNVAPKSYVSVLSEYAIRCVSDANSASSRKWRTALLQTILQGTLKQTMPDGDDLAQMVSIHADLANGHPDYGCPPQSWTCPICEDDEEEGFDSRTHLVAWPSDTKCFQISNMRSIHAHCATKAKRRSWYVGKLARAKRRRDADDGADA